MIVNAILAVVNQHECLGQTIGADPVNENGENITEI